MQQEKVKFRIALVALVRQVRSKVVKIFSISLYIFYLALRVFLVLVNKIVTLFVTLSTGKLFVYIWCDSV